MLQVCTFGISPQNQKLRLKALPQTPPSHGPGTLWDACNRGQVVLGAIDYLDRLKGVAPKLLAWEALLRDYPHYRKGYVLVQVCVGARNRIQIKTAPAVEAELRRIVERINGNYPGTVHFEVRSRMTPAERLQLWCATQVLVITALREAINVSPLEFVLARHLRGLPAGTLVLSEFTGFGRVLNGCLCINPNSQTELVETLDAALMMRPEEREARAAKDLAHIERCTNEAFAQRFLVELKSMATKRHEDFVCVGFGHSKFRLVGMGAGFKPLDTSEALEAFQRAKRRVLLLDWGGTLQAITLPPHPLRPPPPAPPPPPLPQLFHSPPRPLLLRQAADPKGFYDQRDATCFALPVNVLEALRKLCAHPSCHVMIMSGLPKDKARLCTSAAFAASAASALA